MSSRAVASCSLCHFDTSTTRLSQYSQLASNFSKHFPQSIIFLPSRFCVSSSTCSLIKHLCLFASAVLNYTFNQFFFGHKFFSSSLLPQLGRTPQIGLFSQLSGLAQKPAQKFFSSFVSFERIDVVSPV